MGRGQTGDLCVRHKRAKHAKCHFPIQILAFLRDQRVDPAVGFHGAIDFSMLEETSSGAIVAEKRSPLMIGLGLHYSLSIPGFGVL